ncbi:30S ribosomal protein S25e [Staphylothermus hellenicus]|uniref:30S ribosomal protein S25e n=1 Tax=Staphylothermus hellenicus (strain DSM 12710 / JCM 10830 / BK20S6-10-b1 / P8) TaxID=591019 RepID=D7D9A1_STAHD|nr:30S ribosomal protein S25e [Staphylothermus hellenicus]ADI32347.1 hypothetical protein Shell_1249 [Staphylothermus hellenicus DSM 12710]
MVRNKPGKKESSGASRVSIASQIDLTLELIKRFERDLKRGAFNILTPYTLAQAYNIRISVAKKLLREAANRKLLVLYSGGRTPIYIKA